MDNRKFFQKEVPYDFWLKLRTVRLSLNLFQSELAEKTGISERSLYMYEQTESLPRSSNLRKIADALNVSISYLLDEEETNTSKNIDHDIFIANSKMNLDSKVQERQLRFYPVLPRFSQAVN